jgi:hypothetical protein
VLCKHEVVGSIPSASTSARGPIHPWKEEIRTPGFGLAVRLLFDSVDRNFLVRGFGLSGGPALAGGAARGLKALAGS